MVEVVNRQRRKKIVVESWRTLAEKMITAIGKQQADATIAFVSDTKIRDLNRRFRGVNRTTDVLSFPSDDESTGSLGDIAISVDRAEEQAIENGLTFDDEVAQLILHGLLHLSGYDHETDHGEMNRLELRLRRNMGI